MELLSNYSLFLIKTLTVLISILLIISFIVNSKKSDRSGSIEIKNVNKELDSIEENIKKNILTKSDFKKFIKAKKKSNKKLEKRLFVIDFKGNIRASEIVSLRREVSGVILSCKKGDEVLLRLENSGGTVHEHGLAASQLKRIKDKKIPLTICVDKVAASGGYMMACVANKIIASPFAIIGSIGVLAQVPNFNKLLKDKGINFEQHTAGNYKRTVTMFGENTDKDREKLNEQLEEIHLLFKNFITSQRKNIDIEKVATGEYWYGENALSLNLIDEIMTSDEYILSMKEKFEITHIKYKPVKTFSDKISKISSSFTNKAIGSLEQKNHDKNIFK
ncbi:MAG: protease SohB [Gammaproteobacteria bacterium]|nr:protease SohB [Gammaproteobacteria bacterium]MBT6755324.1 protease SohB [Gammaproteobacteria bacterium]MBT7523605.1 protease SohB [Gammaproteobacteria bacterium]MBT7814199.1 protease SohB [Gammaproteobacteria bacterium]